MATYKVTFTRTVITHLDADSEDDIHGFLEDNPDWDILQDAEEIVDAEEDEYFIAVCDNVTADYGILEGSIVEVGS